MTRVSDRELPWRLASLLSLLQWRGALSSLSEVMAEITYCFGRGQGLSYRAAIHMHGRRRRPFNCTTPSPLSSWRYRSSLFHHRLPLSVSLCCLPLFSDTQFHAMVSSAFLFYSPSRFWLAFNSPKPHRSCLHSGSFRHSLASRYANQTLG